MTEPSAPPTDRTLALILCCLGFVVIAGIHRLITGHILLGVVYILTGGLCFIGTIVDLVTIANGSYRDKWGRPLADKG